MSDPSTYVVAAGIGAKKLIESVVSDLYTAVKSGTTLRIANWKVSHNIDLVRKKIRQIRMVKTIWQMEKNVDLTGFYCPARVVIGKARKPVHDLAAFECNGSILIEGTVGQGKSILLRYLASQDVFISKRIPVFVSLQRLRTGQTVVSLALQELSALGLQMDEAVFHYLAAEGRLTLFLDAFDEVKEDLRADTLAEIEALLRRHDRLQAVVTSRPESGIDSLAVLRVFKMCPLVGREYEDVVRRITHDKTTADHIITGIRNQSGRIADVLDTPLMVALLIVRYRIDQSLPQNESSFYEALFMLLLQRHDKSKGGYFRPRKSGLADNDLSEFFNALSFITRKADETSFPIGQLKKYGREALGLTGKQADVDKVLADIIEITCLIISDGYECKFIHKSVQEYHAALFISEQPEASAISFYSGMESRWKAWYEVLMFLERVDRYRFLKYFYIINTRSELGLQGAVSPNWRPDVAQLIKMFGADRVDLGSRVAQGVTHYSTGSHWCTRRLIDDSFEYAKELLDTKIANTAFGGKRPAVLAVSALLTMESSKRQVEQACSGFVGRVVAELIEAEAYVSGVEKRKVALSF